MPNRYTRRAALALAFAAPLAGCASSTNLVTGERQASAYTWQQEVQIGRESDPQIVAQYGVYEDAELQAYVNRVAQDVLQNSAYVNPQTPAEIRSTPFTFRILDSPVVNAFALPGGYIYVTRGLLAHLNNEAQLAVVLGHEIGHVLGRHASNQAARAQRGQLGILGAAILGGVLTGSGAVTEGIANYGGTAAGLLLLRYGRDAERESDRAGVAYAEGAGYDAAPAADFFGSLERLGQQAGSGGVPGFLSTHPDPADRQQSIPQLAAQYSGTEVNAAPYLAQIEGVPLGDDPRQGFEENGTFYHPELRFQFDVPQGYRVQNGAAAVQIAEPNGRAVLQFTFAQEQTAQAAAQAFAGQQGVQVRESGATTVNGNRAYAVSGVGASQQGEIGFLSYFIEYGGRVYQFVGLTAANALGTYANTFERTIQSFERLTDARYLNRQPVRLDLVRVTRAAPFQSFLSGRTLPPGLTAEGLAILNQVDLNGTVAAGATLKLPPR